MQEKVKARERKPYERRTKTAEQALSALMRYAARAERSSGDAMRLMRTWGVPEADRQGVLDKLTEHRFIDDERFAAAYVRDKVRLSGWGVYKIRAGLAAKGIAPAIIDRAVGQVDGGETSDKLDQLLRRKAAGLKDELPYDRRTKLIRYALSRGYGYDEVLDAVDRVVPER